VLQGLLAADKAFFIRISRFWRKNPVRVASLEHNPFFAFAASNTGIEMSKDRLIRCLNTTERPETLRRLVRGMSVSRSCGNTLPAIGRHRAIGSRSVLNGKKVVS